MALTLPTTPAPRKISPRLVTARGELRPAFGGAVQRVERLGSRWAFDVELPPMTYSQAMAWSDLFAEGDTVILRLPQPGFNTGTPGTVLVNGAGQAGSTIVVDGATPSHFLKKGQWLNLTASGQLYVYQLRADTTVETDGEAALPIRPMIRRSPANNSAVEIVEPKVEGFVTLPDGAMSVSVDRLLHGLSFTIEETE